MTSLAGKGLIDGWEKVHFHILRCFIYVLCNLLCIILQCLANLAQWDDLETVASAAIDDGEPPNLNKVWDDTFFQVRTEVIVISVCMKFHS